LLREPWRGQDAHPAAHNESAIGEHIPRCSLVSWPATTSGDLYGRGVGARGAPLPAVQQRIAAVPAVISTFNEGDSNIKFSQKKKIFQYIEVFFKTKQLPESKIVKSK